MPERFCTMYEKYKLLSMYYISALTQASVLTLSYTGKFALNLGYDGFLIFNELMFDNYER